LLNPLFEGLVPATCCIIWEVLLYGVNHSYPEAEVATQLLPLGGQRATLLDDIIPIILL
jgi:hypothetical protein